MNQLPTVERPRLREFSAEFKAGVLEQCRQPGVSLAGVALQHGINANIVDRCPNSGLHAVNTAQWHTM
ncbi:MAG: hypothetical protein U1D27_08540 [Rhodoferax sp.]|uniref:hypothetical protein n=1 Tax=Rhodoferax sp. TaxID=50421 RepID=UPI00273122CB|nr:hypothetical protein [Rhodoferax sp.]MDP2443761.1 hypothetical protein [Rhodoferax sp.]MDZ4207782.1 hypothetical protein [Rhodoferax sp.]